MEKEMDKFSRFFEDNPQLQSQRGNVEAVVSFIVTSCREGGKLLVCGNGGSAADSEHIVGELMKGFLSRRPLLKEEQDMIKASCAEDGDYLVSHLQRPVPAISLVSQSALISAFSNDVAADTVYAQQVLGYGRKGDVFLGISTSGNSMNVVYAAELSKAMGLRTVAMTGVNDSKLSAISDITLRSPRTETFQVQEDHLRLYHLICARVEEALFG